LDYAATALIAVSQASDCCPAATQSVSKVTCVKAGSQKEELECLGAAKLLAGEVQS